MLFLRKTDEKLVFNICWPYRLVKVNSISSRITNIAAMRPSFLIVDFGNLDCCFV